MSIIDKLADDIAAQSRQPVYGVTGSGATLSLVDALEQRGRAFVPTHFEGAAAIMAATRGRLSGKAGVALSIKGPGLTNMVPGLAVAGFETFPLVAIAEAYGRNSPASKAHKRIDQALLTSAMTKVCGPIGASGAGFADFAALAEAEAPGPVVLELAQPEAAESVRLPEQCAASKRAGAAEIARLIAAAKAPVVIAGGLALRQGWSARLNALRVPVFSTAAVKGVVDETSPHAAGVYTGVGLKLAPESVILAKADLVVCLGLRPQEVLATKPFGRASLNIAAVYEPGEDAFEFDAVAGLDAADAAFDALATAPWGDDIVADALAVMRAALASTAFLPAEVYSAVQDVLGPATCGVFDTGYFCTIGEHVWRARDAGACLMSGQGRYMGTGLPMAIGAAMHDAARPVVAFLGDGGIGPFVAEAKLAVEHRLPLLVCLMTDGYLASIRSRALTDRLTERALKINTPSWRKVFDAFGMLTWQVSDASALRDALSAWRPADGPGYVEIAFAPEPYEAMCRGLR